jgi:hypothetical protein
MRGRAVAWLSVQATQLHTGGSQRNPDSFIPRSVCISKTSRWLRYKDLYIPRALPSGIIVACSYPV